MSRQAPKYVCSPGRNGGLVPEFRIAAAWRGMVGNRWPRVQAMGFQEGRGQECEDLFLGRCPGGWGLSPCGSASRCHSVRVDVEKGWAQKGWGGGGGWHKASVSGCLPLAAPIGLSPLLILTLCGSERVLVVSMEPPDDLSCLTTPGSAVPETGCCPCR